MFMHRKNLGKFIKCRGTKKIVRTNLQIIQFPQKDHYAFLFFFSLITNKASKRTKKDPDSKQKRLLMV